MTVQGIAQEKASGADRYDLAETIGILAGIHEALGEDAEAAESPKRAKEIREKAGKK